MIIHIIFCVAYYRKILSYSEELVRMYLQLQNMCMDVTFIYSTFNRIELIHEYCNLLSDGVRIFYSGRTDGKGVSSLFVNGEVS